ncbi:hypothetical protein RJ641_010469 [Dillenia turbinata]|uniref:Uncharacterized protein n=1 Tax=Dillenia turbinata TaxID=194707 RepID=A0AAN8Z2P6_9MAGN
MLDPGRAVSRGQICSPSPVHQKSRSYDSAQADFDFGYLAKNMNHGNFSDLGSSDIEFQVQDGYGGNSPPLWRKDQSKSNGNEFAPLLSQHNLQGNLSPASRRQVIVNRRIELMEMMKNMPESSFELSLKDIVDQQQHPDEVQDGIGPEDGEFKSSAKVQPKRRKSRNKKSNKTSRISRSGSMENEAFLLKMAIPSLGLARRNKSMPNTCSKVSPRESFEGSRRPLDKEWWKSKSSGSGVKEDFKSGSISGSQSSRNNSTCSVREWMPTAISHPVVGPSSNTREAKTGGRQDASIKTRIQSQLQDITIPE